jgi:SagB-type dehydrogenase family enzyme
VKVKAITPLQLELAGERITVSTPRLRKRLRVTRKVAELLLAAQSGLDTAPGDPVVAKLLGLGFLLPHETEVEPAKSPWREWGAAAWNFHTHTRDTPFVVSNPEQLERYREKLADRPAPVATRAPASDLILLLPRVRAPMEASFRHVLESRRTHRHFTEHELPAESFADLLHYSFAPLRFADAGEMGVLQLRAAASGGARHETEAFVAVFAVTGVTPGLYHYDNIRHGLVPLNGYADQETFEHLTHRQGFYRHACFGVLTVAVADRMSWKYRHAAAYKILLQNVGHAAQVFAMTATALGLGTAMTGAIRHTEADTLLELEQPSEFTTFALACGLPELGTDGLPTAIRTPSRPS